MIALIGIGHIFLSGTDDTAGGDSEAAPPEGEVPSSEETADSAEEVAQEEPEPMEATSTTQNPDAQTDGEVG